MEIDGEDGTTIELRAGDEAVLGRGSGFVTSDRTVSRRHILFRADNALTEPVRASFEVLGRNPVWVRRGGGGEVRVYRTSEKGELAAGDWLCLSGRQPAWYAVKGIDAGRDLGSESEVEAEHFCTPTNDVDPVKEFGFLVIGHEFDQYPKQMLRRVTDWNWFLEPPMEDGSEDDDEYEEGKKKLRSRKKRKKLGGDNEDEEGEDEDWTGESEEEKEDLVRPLKARKQAYLTRSKDRRMPSKKSGGGDDKLTQKRASTSRDDDDTEEDEEDEEDETLGGFIVTDDDVEQEEVEGDVDEDEEEYIEDDDEE